jgi:Flp pilus assembly protein TadD
MRLYIRGLRVRAPAQLRISQPALAEKDLDQALKLAPEEAELWLARGAARQVRERYEPMCEDYYQACTLGLCEGLQAAKTQGYCGSESGR